MRGVYAVLWIVFGAGLGLILGLLSLGTWWWGMLIGSMLGLVLGSVVEARRGGWSGDGA